MDEQQQPRFSLAQISLALIAVLLVAGLVSLLWLSSRFSQLEERLSEISGTVEQTREEAGLSREKAEEAAQRAERAQESAADSARDRDLAVRARDDAEDRAEHFFEEALEAKDEAARTRQELTQLEREREEELNRLTNALNKVAETRRTALGLVMNLGSDSVEFDLDKATLRPENRELLSRIAGILLTSSDYTVYVWGHTDDLGSADYNMQLSLQRAEAVRDYLVEAGLDASIMEVKGFGKTRPVVEGKTREARARNRRVEIGIVNTRIAYDRTVKPDN